MDILLKTIHGSHLYNLANADSDTDWYVVYAGKGRAKQTIVDGIDTMTISLDSFLHQCRKGVPQSLEALYSQKKEIDRIPFIADSFNPVNVEVYKTYIRTINNFWADGTRKSSIKRKRHAIRLCFNLSDILRYGKFNPEISLFQRDLIYKLALSENEQCPGLAPSILGIELYTW